MTYFDDSLEFAPVAEQNNDPILPEDRLVFELIGLERSEPDQYRKNGGVKWSWRVFQADGVTPFVFQDEQYIFFRTTGLDSKGKPTMNLGTNAYDWASAMVGHDLKREEVLRPSLVKKKRMSAMVVWEKQKTDPTKKTIKLASLRHVPVGEQVPVTAVASKSAASVSADASDADVDRALVVADVERKIRQAEKLGTRKHLDWMAMDLGSMDVGELQAIKAAVQQDIDAE